MSGAAQNYKIITQTTIIDAMIGGVTFGLLVRDSSSALLRPAVGRNDGDRFDLDQEILPADRSLDRRAGR